MKVPYFLLELEEVCFFQPQNKGRLGAIGFNNNHMTVQSFDNPEYRERELFLNGNRINLDFKIIKVPKSRMIEFKQIIDDYNRRNNV